jgi:hypothetical protein
MGFFSWKTADTQESIPNIHAGKPIRTVYLLQPGGKPSIAESSYGGYGYFGGIDAYAWLARMNSEEDWTDKPDKEIRDFGIRWWFHEREKIRYPLKFSFNPNAVYEALPASEECEYQGYFYPDD